MPPRLLLFTRTTGYRHDSIPAAVAAVRELCRAAGLATEHTEDPGHFRDDRLAGYAAVVWLQASGTVLDAEGRAAYERFTRRGGGFAGVHAAATAEPDWDFYEGLVGARFLAHPPGVHPAVLRVADAGTPATGHLPAEWHHTDEWYTFRTDPRPRVRVQLTLDESTYDPGELSMGGDHPIAWSGRHAGARTWYTALGHAAGTYDDPAFRAHLIGGIRSVLGDP
ncbi:hypothetical protein Sru01_21050 [Sphaerisporangium rufum]|uniref:ThuA-like domain-containing protein n=1 Tax=Sphaerisporangium rufum TaxID=1381558 RepID=A0A919R180_9ACTN|nr:ThuA domain-containing protein [Sphaerisporangium rufum]GII77123.1 hypothetical protein Sru01_21050 [Sphaerisporangium rufum]